MTGNARDVILARIRAVEVRGGTGVGKLREGGDGDFSREYQKKGERSRREVLDLFAQRVADYKATVTRCSPEVLSGVVAEALEGMGPRRVVIPADLPPAWLETVSGTELELLRDAEGGSGTGLSKGQLAGCYGVVTGCALGIAETGTIILDAGPAQGRRALSLLPDHHLCIVKEDQVLETVPEAVASMSRGLMVHGRPFTLISGPSATSDIELIRVEGVHGPRNLEVILVEEGSTC